MNVVAHPVFLFFFFFNNALVLTKTLNGLGGVQRKSREFGPRSTFQPTFSWFFSFLFMAAQAGHDTPNLQNI